MHLLVIRFSSMGDVALTIPVISSLVSHYPEIHITFVTKKEYEPFFYNIPGVELIGVDFKDKHYRGLLGIYRLYRELRRLGPYDYGIDLHDSLRSKILRFFFRKELKFASIVKGRKEKREQTRRKNKILKPLPHTVERYLHVFERTGLNPKLISGPYITLDFQSKRLAKEFLITHNVHKKEILWIGIAPFAGHPPKTWPIHKTKELIRLIGKYFKTKIFLFGGGKKEIELLESIHKEHPDYTIVVAGKLLLEGEMALMEKLDVMIAMDSFNMHIASLIGIPVISIWGATHPFSGFAPFGQKPENIVQIPTEILPCRPCSIFGNKKCFRKDLACLNYIEPEDVLRKLCQVLNLKIPEEIKNKNTLLKNFEQI
ncbi:MAG: glycosyltransferase family 9 protein [Leptospiraceae bacterium]|nr:glycosyltransferase family 9 protein [Leptospiraceae bacterium]MDW7975561.1 glycosyltransferase family 9 protein [Leptospiraceae bacterium]